MDILDLTGCELTGGLAFAPAKPKAMQSKLKTIWHYAFVFFETERQMEDYHWECDNILYQGKLIDMPYDKATEVAQLHPNFSKYYEAAMMPLFQGKGKFVKGTESPQLALKSYLTEKESKMTLPYILVWKAM